MVFEVVLSLLQSNEKVTKRRIEHEMTKKGRSIQRGETPFVREITYITMDEYKQSLLENREPNSDRMV